MQGLERGVLSPSSLHLFWDIMGKLGNNTLILADEEVYQIAKWGLERAGCHGARVVYFKHHNPESLRLQLYKQAPYRQLSIIVLTDGWCPHCGKAAPLPAYLALAREYKGLMLVDDTQALGVLGKNPSRGMPYGEGGGGLLQWFGLAGQDIITICSLAKGFGVPLSVMSGSAHWIKKFEQLSDTRVHCSPVSSAHVCAALHALCENRKHGRSIRKKLFYNVQRFRKLLAQAGLKSLGGFFPVQTLNHGLLDTPQVLYKALTERGVKALLLKPHHTKEPAIAFCLSATHSAVQISRAVKTLDALHHAVLQTV